MCNQALVSGRHVRAVDSFGVPVALVSKPSKLNGWEHLEQYGRNVRCRWDVCTKWNALARLDYSLRAMVRQQTLVLPGVRLFVGNIQ